jgi:general secretion pathway protein F
MPIFRYRGYRTDGSDVAGTIEASGRADAVAKIKSDGILPSEVIEPRPGYGRGIFKKADATEISNLTRQLSILLSSGVPLIDALQSLASEYKGHYRGMLISIKESVAGGTGLHRALENFGNHFPEFYVSMVYAGEQSGTLDRVLVQLADYLERQDEIRSKVRSSMIYPIFMMSVALVVMSFLFTFVIPKIVKIFEDTQGTLPFITLVLIFISNIFIKYWWAVIVLAGALYYAFKVTFRKKRHVVDRMILSLPGNIIQSLYYARFSRTLGFLIEGGLPMLKSLKLSSKSIGNRVLEASVT